MNNNNNNNINNNCNIISVCPHCKDYVLIEQLNCKIFRHGSIKLTGQQIPPHSNKQICDYLYKNNLIYGCGKPFEIIINNNSLETRVCDYI